MKLYHINSKPAQIIPQPPRFPGLNPTQIKALVERCQKAYSEIEHREWNGYRYGMSPSEMWTEASQFAAPKEWHEIIRVLAQGGDYYGIAWD